MLNILDPRGIRNNNPGNIRLSQILWQGQKTEQSDPDFVEFTAPVYGLRALMRTLLTYYLKFGLDTVESLINRYAPPHENATDMYAFNVSRRLGVKRTDKLDLTDRQTLIAIAQAIVFQENGRPTTGRPCGWYDPALYIQAADLALPERG